MISHIFSTHPLCSLLYLHAVAVRRIIIIRSLQRHCHIRQRLFFFVPDHHDKMITRHENSLSASTRCLKLHMFRRVVNGWPMCRTAPYSATATLLSASGPFHIFEHHIFVTFHPAVITPAMPETSTLSGASLVLKGHRSRIMTCG